MVAGWEEVITPLEYTLSLAADGGTPTRELTYQILEETYKGLASMKQQVRVLTVAELQRLTDDVRNFEPSREFVEAAYQDAAGFRQFQAARQKEEAARQAR